jgi:hypothetical protein
MKIQELLEAFDQPLPTQTRVAVDIPERGFKEVHTRFTAPNGDPGRIEYIITQRPDRSTAVDIVFYINDQVNRNPAQGGQQRIFSTVLNNIRQFVQQYRPQVITFSGQGSKRARMYNTMVTRELKNLPGYTASSQQYSPKVKAFTLVSTDYKLPPSKPRLGSRLDRMPGTADHDPRLGSDLDPKNQMARWKSKY